MTKELRQKAKEIVEKRKQKEHKAEVQEVYRNLVRNSEVKELDPKTRMRVVRLREYADGLPIRSMGGSYIIRSLRSRVRDLLETNKFHPKELLTLEQEIMDKKEVYEKQLKKVKGKKCQECGVREPDYKNKKWCEICLDEYNRKVVSDFVEGSGVF